MADSDGLLALGREIMERSRLRAENARLRAALIGLRPRFDNDDSAASIAAREALSGTPGADERHIRRDLELFGLAFTMHTPTGSRWIPAECVTLDLSATERAGV